MPTSLAKNIKAIVFNLLGLLIFWIVLFLSQRLLFIAVNSVKAIDTDGGLLLQSLCRGMIFDISIWGYSAAIACLAVSLFAFFADVRRILRLVTIFVGAVGGIVAFLLPAEAITYRAWGHHVDAGSLMMLAETPELVFASTETWFEIAYAIVCGAAGLLFFRMAQRLCGAATRLAYGPSGQTAETGSTVATRLSTCLLSLVLGGLMIIPIRGGVGLAPLNTGKAYFSQSVFANHAAVNPAWNFLYSLKRARAADARYEFMSHDEMESRFGSLMSGEGAFPKVVRGERPNVVVILLESFSAHGVEYLGGANATPNIDSLRHTGVYFNNFFASADRSGKGLLAVMNAYPGLPTIRVIQFPQKTQNIPSLARRLRGHGYESQAFVYGGDINFNNFNSLVNQNGFDIVVSEDDFAPDQKGDKWGAHDEYAFDRLLSTMDTQRQPFFDFIFTLSSHEPYTVPMERHMDDDYLNSMYYTDMCLGRFMRQARERKWWDNTVFVLTADHGHAGPDNVGVTDRRKFNIPLIITGGALTVRDSLVTTYGSQTDIAATVLRQLGIDTDGFTFSKNLLAPDAKSFAFFDFDDGFGYVTPDNYQVYDNQMKSYLRIDAPSAADTLSGRAYLQKVADDFHTR